MENQDQDSTEKQLDKVDSYLTKFGNILKKHWGKLLLLGFGYLVYWYMSQPAEQTEADEQYQIVDTVYVEDTVFVADTTETE